MKILITTGGTSEPIDQVRAITNQSTGRLGSAIAQACLEAGFEVTLITTEQASKPPAHPLLQQILIKTTRDLESALQSQVPQHQVLIHSMAVSDYRPVQMVPLEKVQEAKNLQAFLEPAQKDGKLSSAADHQVMFLEKTPKLIQQVKDWNPQIRLIGFKLLVSVSPEELLAVACASLTKNRADLIVANDLTQIDQNHHQAYLVEPDRVQEAQTKAEIAQKLVDFIRKES
ncbi:phosphopantothenate--cysteine ligase [Streptococcus danieliae]|uniref:phosphopantothenate--cysteine ligase n=1 Tax=Streptococcus danieliae TaxID=747656 RepID=UPI0021C9CA44|nr:phosphopantothenate--cysteine ligase [Streptococcus danieliae]MCU0082204.1 phosphopantothenate--cysteine ligase [Streptococcus danieliae]